VLRVVLPSDLNDDANWAGGFYELALELGPRDDARLEQALLAVWREGCVAGCFAPEYRPGGAGMPRRLIGHSAIELGLASLLRSDELHGVVRLPAGVDIVCAGAVVRDDETDWLSFCLPIGALARADDRLGVYPFGPDGGRKSLAWRGPIDDWLASVAIGIYAEVQFRLGLIGCEASAEVRAEELVEALGPPYLGYLLPASGGLRYQEATA
jgi:hypothetical protein